MRFTEFTQQMRQDMFQNRTKTTLTVDRTTLGFQTIETDVPSITQGGWIELPPSIVDGRMVLMTTPDDYGRWLRTMLLTYYLGGKVHYKKTDVVNDFEVVISF